jgi:hypothetical protein
VVFDALVFKLSVWCGAEGYVSGLRGSVWCGAEGCVSGLKAASCRYGVELRVVCPVCGLLVVGMVWS